MFVRRFQERSVALAREVDARLAAREPIGPLAGIPLGITATISTAEASSAVRSHMRDPRPRTSDAAVVARLRAAGGIVIGEMATEFAIDSPQPTKQFGTARNPWRLDRWAGGSSSGSACAVATGAVLGAVGIDTRGGVRVPSAYCGVTGLTQTFGRVPKSGCMPRANTLDRLGPITRTARDCALMARLMAGHDSNDVTSVDVPVPDYVAALSGHLSGVRIGFDRLSAVAGGQADPATAIVLDDALKVLSGLGAELVEVDLPLYEEMTTASAVIMLCEVLAYHHPRLQVGCADHFTATRSALGMATFFSAADYVQAQRVRRVGQKRLAELYAEFDLLLTPTSSAPAPMFADLHAVGVGLNRGDPGAVHTPYWNAAGNPVISVPIGFTAARMPLGMQLIGRPFDESLVLRAGDAYQRVTAWHRDAPPIVAEIRPGQPPPLPPPRVSTAWPII
jgi:aspartyl-tRNA(Asn)/glutamyl-tRNA(Gln) amidotransferase subunit A